MAQCRRRRGRDRLTLQFAEFLLQKFPRLRHLGNFMFWNMNKHDRHYLSNIVRSSNRRLLFEEDLTCQRPENEVPFAFKYLPDRFSLACNSIHTMKVNSGSGGLLSEIFDVLAGPPNFIFDDGGGLSDEDPSSDDDDDDPLDDEDDDVDAEGDDVDLFQAVPDEGDDNDLLANAVAGGPNDPAGLAGEAAAGLMNLDFFEDQNDHVCVIM